MVATTTMLTENVARSAAGLLEGEQSPTSARRSLRWLPLQDHHQDSFLNDPPSPPSSVLSFDDDDDDEDNNDEKEVRDVPAPSPGSTSACRTETKQQYPNPTPVVPTARTIRRAILQNHRSSCGFGATTRISRTFYAEAELFGRFCTLKSNIHKPYNKIFCDLDGVLVDFELGVRKIFPDLFRADRHFTLQDLEKSLMWERVAAADAFFEKLPWMEGGRRLWDAIRHLRPDILTGVPSHEPSRTEKFNWCRRELGLSNLTHVDMAGHDNYNHECVRGRRHVPSRDNDFDHDDSGYCTNVITCWSFNKHHESGPGMVLIDDRESLRDDWEAKGGIFVHHVNVDSTLTKLRRLAII